MGGAAGATVVPVINSIGLTFGLVGTAKTFTISGSGLTGGSIPGTPAIQLTGTGGVSATIQSESDTAISITLNSTPGTSSGTVNIAVTVDSETSNSKSFLVQIPSRVTFYPNGQCTDSTGEGPLETPNGADVYLCDGSVRATNACGVYRNVMLYLLDQDGGPIFDAYSIEEILNGTLQAPSIFVPSGGTATVPFADNHGLWVTGGGCLATNQNASVTQTCSTFIGSVAYPLSTVIGITEGNYNGTLETNVIIGTR